MKPFRIKCKMRYNLFTPIRNDERPEVGETYTVVGVKRVELKGTNKSFLSFKLKEFEDNEVIEWFSEDAFEFDRKKAVENFTEII